MSPRRRGWHRAVKHAWGGRRDSTPARGSLQPRGGGGACACSSWRLGAAGEGGRVPSPVTATTEDDVDPSGKEAWAAEGQDARRPALGHRLAPFQRPLREGVPGRVGDARCRRRSPGSVSSRRPGDWPFPTAGSRAGGAGVGAGVGACRIGDQPGPSGELAGPAPHPGRGAGRPPGDRVTGRGVCAGRKGKHTHSHTHIHTH